MATQVYLHDGPSFIFYLLNQQRTKPRRRLAKFNLVYEQSKVGGYFWRNPLTGFNYAYRLRIDNTDRQEWEKQDANLKVAAVMGAIMTGVSTLYLGVISKPWYWYPLLVLGSGVGVTEGIGAAVKYLGMTRFKSQAEHQKEMEDEYAKGGAAKEFIDLVYKGDPEYASTKIWFGYYQDKILPLQGSSIVTNTLSGFAVHKFWWQGLRHRYGWLVWILGLLAQYPTLDALLALVVMWGPQVETGSQVAHGLHLFGFLTGATLSWIF